MERYPAMRLVRLSAFNNATHTQRRTIVPFFQFFTFLIPLATTLKADSIVFVERRPLLSRPGIFNLRMVTVSSRPDVYKRQVQKYVDMDDFNEPPPKPERRLCPKLDPYKPTIDEWLIEDKQAPRKQRHTAQRVFNRLKKECPGFNCSYRCV